MLARSLAGHDRGKVFVVVDLTEEYALLADGRGRTSAEPKKKNRRHIAVIRKKCEDTASDAAIRKTLKEYENREGKQECQKQM